MKEYRTTIIALLVLVVVISGFVIVNNILGKKEPIDNDQTDSYPVERVLAFHPDNVVKIESSYKEKYIFERTDSSWKCITHTDLALIDSNLDSLLNVLANLKSKIIVNEDEKIEDLSNFGLDGNPYYFKIFLKDGKEHKILMGNTNLTGSEIYFMFEGGKKIYRDSSTTIQRMQLTRDKLISKRVFNFDNSERINTIQLIRNNETKFVIKADFSGETRKWSLTEPVEVEGNSENISSLLESLMTLTLNSLANSNVADLSEYGLDVPVAKYVVTDNKITKTFEVGKKTPDGGYRYCSLNGENHIFTINIDFLTFIDNSVTDYMFSYAFLEDQKVLSHVEIDLLGTVYKLDYEVEDKEENYWFNGVNVNIPGRDLKSSFKKITTSIYSLKLEEIEEEPVQMGEKICTIKYIRKDKTTVTVDFYKRDETTAYIYRNGKYMFGYLYTRRITGDSVNSVKTVIEHFASELNG